MKCIVCCSGGLDSSTILKHAEKLGYEVYWLFFDYDQRHKNEFLHAVNQINDCKSIKSGLKLDLKALNLVAVSSLTRSDIDVALAKDILGDPQTVNYVPFRNMVFLSLACSFAESVGAEVVFHGSALVDSQAGYWDGSIEFIDSINSLIRLNRRHKIKIETPLINMTKAEIIKYGFELGVNFANTCTCYSGKSKGCGYCTACASRIQGFIVNKRIDPVLYERSIDWNAYDCK